MTRPRYNAGFTLLELLVVVALLALIVALILSAIEAASGALKVIGRRIEEGSTDSVQFVLRQIVSQARPIRKSALNPEDGRMMDGNRESMRFITSFAAGGQYGGLIETILLIRPPAIQGGLADLVIRQAIFRRPLPSAPPAPLQGRDVLILPSIAQLSLRYFGKPDDNSQPIWSHTWSNATRLPLLVEISVTFPVADPRKWPPLIIPCRLAE